MKATSFVHVHNFLKRGEIDHRNKKQGSKSCEYKI